MERLIDIHCHIIPGVDDGVATLEEALALIKSEEEGGTDAFIATPHFIDRGDYRRLSDVAERVQDLSQEVAKVGLKSKIYPGGEIYPTMAIFEALDAGRSLTLAAKGKHMLVDLPMGSLPNDFDSILYEIQVRGIVPILAHPERCAYFQDDPNRLVPYLERNISCQVNARSLSGRYGTRANTVALEILKRHWAHFLSSDCHKARREPVLGVAKASLKGVLDTEYLEILTRASAEAVIRGDVLPILQTPKQPTHKPGWLSRVFRT